MTADAGTESPEDRVRAQESRAAALDLLIEQEHKLRELYDARGASADAKAAAALTAALGLLTVTLTVTQSSGDLSHGLLVGVLVLIGALTILTLGFRFVGIHRRRLKAPAARSPEHRPPLLYYESELARDARNELWDNAADGDTPNEVRARALRLWRGRAKDARDAFIAKERWLVVASVILAAAVILSAILVLDASAGQGKPPVKTATRAAASAPR